MQDNFSATCQNNLRPKESSRILDQTEKERERGREEADVAVAVVVAIPAVQLLT